MLLLSHRNVMTSIVFSQKNLKVVAKMGLIAATIAILLYCLLIPRYGVGGVVIGYLAHELIHTLFYYFYYFPKVLLFRTPSFLIKTIIPVWIVAVTIVVLLNFISTRLQLNDFSVIFINVFLFTLIFSVFVWFIYLNKDDKKFLVSLIRR